MAARTGQNPNAETMIAENQARWPEELLAANNRPIDAEATNEMSEEDAQGLLDDDNATVLSYAVRGPFVVVVSEDADGNVTKQAFPREGHEKQAERLAPKRGDKDAEKADEKYRERAEKRAEKRAKEAEKAEEEQAEEDDSEAEAAPAEPPAAEAAAAGAATRPTAAGRGARRQ
jgi:hypothetical protein